MNEIWTDKTRARLRCARKTLQKFAETKQRLIYFVLNRELRLGSDGLVLDCTRTRSIRQALDCLLAHCKNFHSNGTALKYFYELFCFLTKFHVTLKNLWIRTRLVQKAKIIKFIRTGPSCVYGYYFWCDFNSLRVLDQIRLGFFGFIFVYW